MDKVVDNVVVVDTIVVDCPVVVSGHPRNVYEISINI